ncbi:MAG: transporter, partial [Planctomycetaceae bacterium]|nr:transporter [Planctomycetaceae bacterium]
MSRVSNFFRSPVYGWVIVVLAALAMVATLPGRTHGLGMITERLLNDSMLQLDRQMFGYINLWATLAGALFCIPAGWMLDRCGLRVTSSLVVGLLGLVVIAMTNAVGVMQFAILITLTRGLGQSALSVVSISMTGKWFREKLPLATGVYSLLVSVGFAAAFIWGRGLRDWDWRTQWSGLGAVLLFGVAPLFALLVRTAPDDSPENSSTVNFTDLTDFTLSGALATPAFWMFGIATSLYGLVSSGVSLFSESLLIERGFEKTAFYDLGMMTTAIGLIGNLLTGWLATRIKITVLAAVAMGLLAAALLGLPFVSTYSALVTYAVVMGSAGGMVTVLFFT